MSTSLSNPVEHGINGKKQTFTKEGNALILEVKGQDNESTSEKCFAPTKHPIAQIKAQCVWKSSDSQPLLACFFNISPLNFTDFC